VVEVDHLVHARGQVRCNLCGTVFDGMETLSADKPHEDEDLLLHDFDNAPPLLTQAFQTLQVHLEADEDDYENEVEFKVDINDDYEVASEERDVASELDDIIAEAVADSSEDDDLPEFVISDEPVLDVPFVAEKQAKQKPKKSSWLWSGLAAAMFIALVWQAQSAIASGQIKLPEHPVSDRICDWFECAKAVDKVDLNAISLVSRNIRPHPGRDQSLIISASMINANESNRVFPALEIKLSDLNGQIVAMRRFIADEYIPADVMKVGFLSNTLIPINLEIVSPGENAVAFEIGFVQP